MYNLLFSVEIALKFYLSRFLNIDEFENIGHNVYQLIDKVEYVEKSRRLEELKEMLRNFRDKNNRYLHYEHYYDYKYNHKIGNNELIFDFNISEKDRVCIEEVIEWLKNLIQS